VLSFRADTHASHLFFPYSSFLYRGSLGGLAHPYLHHPALQLHRSRCGSTPHRAIMLGARYRCPQVFRCMWMEGNDPSSSSLLLWYLHIKSAFVFVVINPQFLIRTHEQLVTLLGLRKYYTELFWSLNQRKCITLSTQYTTQVHNAAIAVLSGLLCFALVKELLVKYQGVSFMRM
jgi:hypothetical protein